jgi:hypothetical protein
MKPRARIEIIRRRSEDGPSCLDESIEYQAIARGMEEIRDWGSVESVGVIVLSRARGEKLSLCTIEVNGKSVFHATEEAKLRLFIAMTNKDNSLCGITLTPTYKRVEDNDYFWEPLWWSGSATTFHNVDDF